MPLASVGTCTHHTDTHNYTTLKFIKINLKNKQQQQQQPQPDLSLAMRNKQKSGLQFLPQLSYRAMLSLPRGYSFSISSGDEVDNRTDPAKHLGAMLGEAVSVQAGCGVRKPRHRYVCMVQCSRGEQGRVFKYLLPGWPHHRLG